MSGTKIEIVAEKNKDLDILLDAIENGAFDHITHVEKLAIVQGTAPLFGLGSKSVLKIEAVLKENLDEKAQEKLAEAMQTIMSVSTKLITTFK